jgi:hypothetical protein
MSNKVTEKNKTDALPTPKTEGIKNRRDAFLERDLGRIFRNNTPLG